MIPLIHLDSNIDYLAQYRLVDRSHLEMYGRAFTLEDEDEDGIISYEVFFFFSMGNWKCNFSWGGSVGLSTGRPGCRAGGREFDSGWTNTQGLKITEEKVLPL